MSTYSITTDDGFGEITMYTHDEAKDGPVDAVFEDLCTVGYDIQIDPMPGEE